jgi:hypothetical protein
MQNAPTRYRWIESKLAGLPPKWRILDAGCGEQPFKPFCSHLQYVAQDFGKYDGMGDGRGLQMGEFDQSKLDFVCDITSIPQPDASFDAILCTEVLEHVPNPILTAPFCSLTHFAPFHFSTGFNRYFYEHHLAERGYKILEISQNGNFFEYFAQELLRVRTIAERYVKMSPNFVDRAAMLLMRMMLQRFSKRDTGSSELLCFGYHVYAQKMN